MKTNLTNFSLTALGKVQPRATRASFGKAGGGALVRWLSLRLVKSQIMATRLMNSVKRCAETVSGQNPLARGIALALIVGMVAVPVSGWATDPIFVKGGQTPNTTYYTNAALGDLDGDGDLDAFVINSSHGTSIPAKVWFNDGKGEFTDSGQSLDEGSLFASDVALVDFDQDGDLDAFVLHYGGQPSKIFWNDGKGHFTDSGQNLHNPDAFSFALGDLDNDGDLDMVTVSAWGLPAKIWINQGKGIFQDSGKTLPTSHSDDVALGDVDKDGNVDIVINNAGQGGVEVWLNDGTVNFTNSGQFIGSTGSDKADGHSDAIALGDVDGDGDLDLFIANGFNNTNHVADEVWLNDGKGHFTDSGQRLGTGHATELSLKDIDNDGDLDAVVANGTNGVSEPDEVWINDGKGNFTLAQLLGNSETGAVLLGDLDGDGYIDAFAVNYDSTEIWLNQLPQPSSSALTITTIGNGTVTCNNTTCQSSYPVGDTVNLVATPADGSSFKEWLGDCSGMPSTTNVIMDAAKNCTAVFVKDIVALTITTVGNGTVTCNNTTCQPSYPVGDTVGLTAKPADGFTFKGWTETGNCSGAATTTIKMDAAKNCTATFEPVVGKVELTLTPSPILTDSQMGTTTLNINPTGNCGPISWRAEEPKTGGYITNLLVSPQSGTGNATITISYRKSSVLSPKKGNAKVRITAYCGNGTPTVTKTAIIR